MGRRGDSERPGRREGGPGGQRDRFERGADRPGARDGGRPEERGDHLQTFREHLEEYKERLDARLDRMDERLDRLEQLVERRLDKDPSDGRP